MSTSSATAWHQFILPSLLIKIQKKNKYFAAVFKGKAQSMEKHKKPFLPDASVINLDKDYEMQYWTSQLKVTNDELIEAVAAVGNSIEAVKVYLNKA